MSPTSDDSDMDDNETKARQSAKTAMTKHPGPRANQHVSEAIERSIRSDLANEDLLETAEGGVPSAVRLLIDVPLDRIPGRPGDRRHDDAVFKAEMKNVYNGSKRINILLRYWTKIYSRLSESCRDTCPALHEEMYQLCDMSSRGYPSGTFDGPLAFRMYLASLHGPDRTKADRDFYETVLTLMRTNHLPDNCTGSDYLDKAMAFIVHVYKNVPRPFTPELAGQELIDFMPHAVAADGRRLLADLKRVKMLGDLRHVAHACEDVVETAHDANRPTPSVTTFIKRTEMRGRSLKELAQASGMAFCLDSTDVPRGNNALVAHAPSGGGTDTKKWCPDCPHTRRRDGEPLRCFADPTYHTTLPASLAARPEKVTELEGLRKQNASSVGVAYVPHAQPTASAIQAWRDAREARSRSNPRGPAGGARKAKKAAGAAVSTDFMANLVEFTDPEFTSKVPVAAAVELPPANAVAQIERLLGDGAHIAALAAFMPERLLGEEAHIAALAACMPDAAMPHDAAFMPDAAMPLHEEMYRLCDLSYRGDAATPHGEAAAHVPDKPGHLRTLLDDAATPHGGAAAHVPDKPGHLRVLLGNAATPHGETTAHLPDKPGHLRMLVGDAAAPCTTDHAAAVAAIMPNGEVDSKASCTSHSGSYVPEPTGDGPSLYVRDVAKAFHTQSPVPMHAAAPTLADTTEREADRGKGPKSLAADVSWCVAFHPDGSIAAVPVEGYSVESDRTGTVTLVRCESEAHARRVAVEMQDDGEEAKLNAIIAANPDASESRDPRVPVAVINHWKVVHRENDSDDWLECLWYDEEERLMQSSPIQWLSTAESTLVTANSTYSLGKMQRGWAKRRCRRGLSLDIDYESVDVCRGREWMRHHFGDGYESDHPPSTEHGVDGLPPNAAETMGNGHAAAQGGLPPNGPERDMGGLPPYAAGPMGNGYVAAQGDVAPSGPPPGPGYPRQCECNGCEHWVYANEGTADQPTTLCDYCWSDDEEMPCQCPCSGCAAQRDDSSDEGAGEDESEGSVADADPIRLPWTVERFAPVDGPSPSYRSMVPGPTALHATGAQAWVARLSWTPWPRRRGWLGSMVQRWPHRHAWDCSMSPARRLWRPPQRPWKTQSRSSGRPSKLCRAWP